MGSGPDSISFPNYDWAEISKILAASFISRNRDGGKLGLILPALWITALGMFVVESSMAIFLHF